MVGEAGSGLEVQDQDVGSAGVDRWEGMRGRGCLVLEWGREGEGEGEGDEEVEDVRLVV